MTMFVTVIGIFVLFPTTFTQESPELHNVYNLTKNSGAYYEYKGNVHLIRSYWKITVGIDCKSLNYDTKEKLDLLDATYKRCYKMLNSQCDRLIPRSHLKQTIKNIKDLNTDVLSYIKSSALHEDIQGQIRKKRYTPFAAVGWASKKLFGTMDADDRELLDKQINQLFNRQRNISFIEAEKTHLIKANIEHLYQTINKNRVDLENIEAKVYTALSDARNNINNTLYLNTIESWVKEFEKSLSHATDFYKELIRVIQTTSQGHFHPLLFSHEQLQNMVADINDHTSHSVLPWEKEVITPEYIFSMARSSVLAIHGGIVIMLSIPLADTSNYLLYEIHSLPVVSKFIYNHKRYIQIKPKHNHLLISKDSKTYALPTTNILENCHLYNSTFLCKPSFPLLKNKLRTIKTKRGNFETLQNRSAKHHITSAKIS